MPSLPSDKAISIIMPVLNEAAVIEAALISLQPWRHAGHEIIVVDGGSVDATMRLAGGYADRVIESAPGRARQMNSGANVARHAQLLFLHADTLLPAGAAKAVTSALGKGLWGRFDVRIEPADRVLRIVAWCMNQRSRLTGIATGDQAIFVRRSSFEQVGGYPEIALMEDLALADRLKSLAWPVCLRLRVITSARRWREHGRLRTVVKMWRLRLAYRLGADPSRLAREYYR